jgi:hypothetical protein
VFGQHTQFFWTWVVDARARTGAGAWWLDEKHEIQRSQAPIQQQNTDCCSSEVQ